MFLRFIYIENINRQRKQTWNQIFARFSRVTLLVTLRLYTAKQKDCRPNFKLLSKNTAGQEGLVLTENFNTKHTGFSVENKAQNREILRLFCCGTEQELRDMSAFLLRIYFVVYGF